jgi:DNA-binding MarR family transcriptional regulator
MGWQGEAIHMSQGLFQRLQQELEAREKFDGLSMADILALPAAERSLINWMVRNGNVTLAEVADHLGLDESGAHMQLAALLEKGYVRETVSHGVTLYQALPENLWQALSTVVDKKDAD